MVNYENGKIYKIVCNITKDIYIGSTCMQLCKRLASHKSDYKSYLNGKSKFVSSFKVLEKNDYSIILLENYSCTSKEQLLARERYYFDEYDCVNKYRPYATDEEQKEMSNQLRKINRKLFPEKRSLETAKYREKHAEEIKAKLKDWREKNKEKIHAKKNEKTLCECGGSFTECHRALHFRTKKHIRFLEMTQID